MFALGNEEKIVIAVDETRKKVSSRSDEDVLKAAKENVESWYSYFSENIERFRQDVNFVYGDQWNDMDRRRRTAKAKSVMQFNQLYTHISQIVGEQREATPQIEVRAKSAETNQKELDLRAGILRQISYESRADIAYQTCFRNQITGGYGVLAVGIEYEKEDSFNLVARIRSCDDPNMFFFDPNATKEDKSDGKFCGCYVSMSRKDVERRWPGVTFPKSFSGNSHLSWDGWGNDERISILDYFEKEYFKDTYVKLSDGREMWLNEAKKALEIDEQIRENIIPLFGDAIPPLEIESKRKVNRYKIMHYKLCEGHVLEKAEWPSKRLPFVYVDGDSVMIDGQQATKGFIHFAKDAQKMINFVGSEIADAIVHSHRSQWIATPENFTSEEIQNIWRNPENHQVLVASYDSAGRLPTKNDPFSLSNTLFNVYGNSQQDITNILGRYQSNLGAPSNENSGIAIANRMTQGSASSYIYFDNLNRGIESINLCLLDVIGNIYDNTRDMPIREKDDTQKVVTLNQPGNPLLDGAYQNQIKPGDYFVELSVGPNYAMQKAQQLDSLLKMVSINPQVFPLVADLIAKNIDVENMPQIVERFKTLVPQQILAKESGMPMPTPAPQPPNPQMQLEQMRIQNEMKKAQNDAIENQIQANENIIKYQAQMAQNGIDNKKIDAEIAKANAEVQKAVLDYEQSRGNVLANYMSER